MQITLLINCDKDLLESTYRLSAAAAINNGSCHNVAAVVTERAATGGRYK